MVSEYETSYEPPAEQRKSSVPWIILIVIGIVICCCCTFIVSGWIFGDLVLEVFDEVMRGLNY